MGSLNHQKRSILAFCIISCHLFLSLLCVFTFPGFAGASNGIWIRQELQHSCTRAEQRNATEAMNSHNCVERGPRDEIVRLALPNDSFADVIPNHVLVKRCGGSCSMSGNRHFSCLPATSGIKEISVCLTPAGSESGMMAPQCAIARVEEHYSCRCGCKISQADCTRRSGMIGGAKRYIEQQCKCECENVDQRTPCLEGGNYWDDRSCTCFCKPQHEWPDCHSGYAFDHSPGTCACVSYTTNAAFVIDVLIIVVILGLAKISFGLVHCYRSRTGFFKPSHPYPDDVTPRRNLFTQTSTTSNTEVPLCVASEESDVPMRGATRIPQMIRIKSLIGQFWNSHSSQASAESGTSGVATANETGNVQPQETSPILRNNYLYAPLGNERSLSIGSIQSREGENRQSFSTDVSNLSSDREDHPN